MQACGDCLFLGGLPHSIFRIAMNFGHVVANANHVEEFRLMKGQGRTPENRLRAGRIGAQQGVASVAVDSKTKLWNTTFDAEL